MKKILKNFIKLIFVLLIIILIFITYQLLIYVKFFKEVSTKQKMYAILGGGDIKTKLEEKNKYYFDSLTILLPKLLTSEIKTKENKTLKYYGLTSSEVYPLPSVIADYADVLISYGIAPDCFFEDNFNHFFNKPVYAFDSTIDSNQCKNTVFKQESIAPSDYPSDEYKKFYYFIMGLKSKKKKLFVKNDIKGLNFYKVNDISKYYIKYPIRKDKKFHYFTGKIRELNLEDKNLYIKLNIGELTFYVIDDILKHSDNIAAISVVLPFDNTFSIDMSSKTIDKLEENFVLVTRVKHWRKIPQERKEIKYVKGDILTHVLLTFINKKYIDKAYVPFNQSNKIDIETLVDGSDRYYKSTISPIVVLAKKLKLVE